MSEQLSCCIICLKEQQQESLEHIVPRSLGNIHYILRKGKVCRSCNNGFARYESAVLTSATWLKQRQAYGVAKANLRPHRINPAQNDLRRFLMKICFESIYQSRPKLLNQYNLDPLREELATGQPANCEIISSKYLNNAKNIPGIIDSWRLGNNHIYLKYKVLEGRFFFVFRYGPLSNVLILNFNI